MSQYNQVLLLYDQLNNMADEIKSLIDKELFDYVLDKMDLHQKVITQIRLIHKCTKFSEEEMIKINELKKVIKQKEAENISTLHTKMEQVKIELSKTNMQNKLQKAYSQIASDNNSTIIDVDDSYQ